ncbi:MAG: hypothetical protein JWM68_4129 [Verrucomicrobiales bacterium]|nr:hypothetical protein [Verrucomicrobiales bacterium]
MIQNVLRALGGIETYGIISVCLFFAVFVVALLFAVTRKKPFCKTMSALPLDDDNQTVSTYEK